MFKITKKWLDSNKTMRGGYTEKQMSTLCMSWPPKKNWQKDVIDKRISITSKIIFEESKRSIRSEKLINAKLIIFNMKIRELKDIDQYIKRLIEDRK